MKLQTCKSIDHRCDVQSTYVTVPTSSNITQTVFLYNVTASCLRRWSRRIFKRRHPQKRNFCKMYVRARAITCPIFQCFVCLCEIVSNKLPTIMHSKTFIHAQSCILRVHAFDKIVMLFIRICILNSYVNFNQNPSCQLQISSANCNSPFFAFALF